MPTVEYREADFDHRPREGSARHPLFDVDRIGLQDHRGLAAEGDEIEGEAANKGRIVRRQGREVAGRQFGCQATPRVSIQGKRLNGMAGVRYSRENRGLSLSVVA